MSNETDAATRARRSSITAATFGSLFARSNSTAGTPPFPAAPGPDQRRRMSISTVGLSGTSPNQAMPFGFGGRRGSVSTDRSDSVDESAIDDDESPGRSNPTTPFARRMSFGAQALRSRAGNSSPGTNGEGGFNWSEQLRSRAESSVSQTLRPNFSSSNGLKAAPTHERAKSVAEMPVLPSQIQAPTPPKPMRPKPDAFQERILKGDFYMD